MYYIFADNDETMLNIVEGLVHRGLTFKVIYEDGLGRWKIELTGGY